MGHRSKLQGFSLLELMVVIVIIGVLLAVGLPSFQSTLRSNRLATTTNQLNAAIALARSEAIKSTQAAALCPSANGTACGADWAAGWLIWRDSDRDGVLDNGEPVLQYFANNAQIAVSAGTAASFGFDDRGGAAGRTSAGTALTSATDITLTTVPCPTGKPFLTKLSVKLTGQISTTRGNCP